MSEVAAKTCRFCRQDVSSKPRIKDRKGRYSCRPCFERLNAKRSADRSPATPQPASEEPLSLEIESGMIDAGAASPRSDALYCPECAMPVERTSVLCVHCGFSPGAGTRLQTEVGKRAELVDHTRGPISWENQVAALVPVGAVFVYLVFPIIGRLLRRTDLASHINWTLVGNVAVLAIVSCYPIGCIWAATNDARRHHSSIWAVSVAILPPVTLVHIYARAESATLKIHMALSIAVATGITLMVLKGGIAG